MKDPRLLASAALFRELYDNNRDIYDVISEFIRASVLLNAKWSFNASECAQDLHNNFGFQIPEAVIKTCLKNRLVKSGDFLLNHGIFSTTEKFDRSKSIQSSFDSAKREYDEIVSNLLEHVKNQSKNPVDEENLKLCFSDYLLDDSKTSEFGKLISHFVIQNQTNESFRKSLNKIEEGLILYTGIQYTSDLSSLGSWRSDLTIFLDTEHLFSANGLNGILYKRIFDDFISLVKEINIKKYGKISIRYFQETMDDVDKFFYAAEKTFENGGSVNPSKTAMLSILDGCQSKSDIVTKKTQFYNALQTKKILLEDPINYYENTSYNIESFSLIETLKSEFNGDREDYVYSEILKKFTKINYLRKGRNSLCIDQINAIFMTENGLTQQIAFHKEIKSAHSDIPFATNIEFMTERFWFKLNKGFSLDKTPISFDIITKAKIVLSSQLNGAISDTYRSLKKQYAAGEISNQEVAILINELRSKPSKPEDFTPDVIDDSINFISAHFIENVIREKSILERKSLLGDIAIEKLKVLEYEKNFAKKNSFKLVAKRQYRLLQLFVYFFLPLLITQIIVKIHSPNDTVLSIVFGLVGIVGLIVTVVKIRNIDRLLWSKSKQYYKNCVINQFR